MGKELLAGLDRLHEGDHQHSDCNIERLEHETWDVEEIHKDLLHVFEQILDSPSREFVKRDQLPEKNIYWRDAMALPGVEVCLTGWVYIMEHNSFPEAVIYWEGREAREAQAWLDSVAFSRCGVEDCGIRVGANSKFEKCANHKVEKLEVSVGDVKEDGRNG